MSSVVGYLLAGGASSRFGRNKAREVVRGKPLLRHSAELAETVTGRPPIVVGRRPGEYDDLGLVTVADDAPDLGPLAGLARALRHARNESHAPAVLLVPCDWIGARAAWCRALVEAWRDGDHAVAYRAEFWEPLPAVYGTGLLDRVRESLGSGDRSLAGLLEVAGARAMTRPSDWDRAVRIDRPEDVTRYLADEGSR